MGPGATPLSVEMTTVTVIVVGEKLPFDLRVVDSGPRAEALPFCA